MKINYSVLIFLIFVTPNQHIEMNHYAKVLKTFITNISMQKSQFALGIEAQPNSHINSVKGTDDRFIKFLKKQYPKYDCSIYKKGNLIKGKLSYIIFNYGDKEKDYGSGVLLWNQITDNPFWLNLTRGDFEIHTVIGVELNEDKKLDLVLHGGFDGLRWTKIFILKTSIHSSFEVPNYKLVGEFDDQYSRIIDLNNDGNLEILVSGTKIDWTDPGAHQVEYVEYLKNLMSKCDSKLISDKYYQKIKNLNHLDYKKLKNPDDTPQFLFFFYPINIYRVLNAGLEDITHKFQNHLKLRMSVLENLITRVKKKEVKKELQKTIDYLRKKINQDDKDN